ncbi:hypothetical protein ACHAPW_009142 [Verticillium nonalfalfae]
MFPTSCYRLFGLSSRLHLFNVPRPTSIKVSATPAVLKILPLIPAKTELSCLGYALDLWFLSNTLCNLGILCVVGLYPVPTLRDSSLPNKSSLANNETPLINKRTILSERSKVSELSQYGLPGISKQFQAITRKNS